MRNYKIIILLLLLFRFADSTSYAISPINISHEAEIFIDSNHQFDIQSIQNKTFTPSQEEVLNFGNNKATIWIRFKLPNQLSEPVIHLKTALIEDVLLYTPIDSLGFKIQDDGYTKKFDSKKYKIPTTFFDITSDYNSDRYFYLKINANYLQFWLYYGTPKSYFQYIYDTSIADGIYYGFIIIMLIYNLFVYFSVKDTTYLYYVLYMLAVGLMVAHFQGHDAHLWGNINFIAERGPIWPSLAGLASIVFAYKFLKIKIFIPHLRYPFFAGMFFFVIAIISVLLGYNLVCSIINQVSGIFGAVLMFYSSFVLINKGKREAKLFLIAFSCYMSAALIFVLAGANIIPYTLFTDYIWQIGSTCEMFFLALAIGQKINDLEKEKSTLIINQNRVLEEKVTERTEELNATNEELSVLIEQVSQQNEVIHKKNVDLESSINYAQRIQEAILPSKNILDENIKDHFIIYQPKDVVSGDIYWYKKYKGYHFLAAIDCTGHGVPGAFVSVMASDLLREVVTLSNSTSPGDILNRLDEEVKTTLNQKNNNNKEGMDITLCVWNDDKETLYFSGAKNPLTILRTDGEVEIIKGDKKSVGGNVHPNYEKIRFTTHEIQLNDTIKGFYIFSDGIQDQFGGQYSKKWMRKGLINSIKKHQDESFQQQGKLIFRDILDWKGNQKQIDDMLLIGFLP